MGSMSSPSPSPVVFEPAYLDGFRAIYEEKIVFNRMLGLRLTLIEPGHVQARIDMREELVGHFAYRRIHGGVISAALDAMGSAAVMADVAARHMDEEPLKRLERFARLGTIDLRIDYLRPGIGDFFTLHAHCLRAGSRVGTSRMEFRGPDGALMSVGAAAYIVS
jgi:uncharacterized protein (TIGR00369 family)